MNKGLCQIGLSPFLDDAVFYEMRRLPCLRDVFSETRRWHSRTSTMSRDPSGGAAQGCSFPTGGPPTFPGGGVFLGSYQGGGAWGRKKRGCHGSPGSRQRALRVRSAQTWWAGKTRKLKRLYTRSGALGAAGAPVTQRPEGWVSAQGARAGEPSRSGQDRAPGKRTETLVARERGKEAALNLHA